MGFADRIDPSEVKDAETLATYVQQTVGSPYPTGAEIAIFKRKLKDTLKNNPNLTLHSICRVAQWARAKKKRPARAYAVFSMIGWAYSDGYVPELNPANQKDDDLETEILRALEVETDPEWRAQLFGAEGMKVRAALLERWQQHRGALV